MSTPYYSDDAVTLYHGDCLDILAELPDESVHAVVTDPPYGLANTDPAHVVETLTRWANGDRDYLPGGAGFMGKAWDAFVPPVAVWDECMRVLKPGGHLLAFAGSRTFDLMTLGVRMAGFEIRDGIAWLYAQGFPKSLDVSKAIDKRPGVTAHAEFSAHLAHRRNALGLSRADVSERVVGTRSGACWNWEHHQFPEAKWWPALRDLLGLDDETWGPAIAEAERAKTGTHASGLKTGASGVGGGGDGGDRRDSARTDAARTWQGWGTALKPAFEPVVVARKPLKGTVAANVLAHGTGAINVDGCRVGDEVRTAAFMSLKPAAGNRLGAPGTAEARRGTQGDPKEYTGRWPANVVLDETAAAELDEQTGILTSGANPTRRGTDKFRDAYGDFKGQEECTPARGADSGGASRMFPVFRYEPKAPTTERPRHGAVAHPTVKPLDLMRWLVRLVTPPGGTVLEPFAGSGTTAEACVAEGFQCIAIEREADYLPLIMQRLSKPIQVALDFDGEAS